MIAKILKTAPAGMPITKAQVKSFTFINNTQQDTAIDEQIPAAVSWAEDHTGRVFVNQVWEIYYDLPDFMNVMELSTLNVNSIVAVNLYDRDNVATLVDSSNYRLFNDQIIFNESQTFTANSLRLQQSVVIEVNAGYGVDSTDQPEKIQSALAQLVSYWIKTNQMARSKGSAYEEIPYAVEGKLSAYVKKLHWI